MRGLTYSNDETGKVEFLVADVNGVQVHEDGETLVDLLWVSWEAVLRQSYHVALTLRRRDEGREG